LDQITIKSLSVFYIFDLYAKCSPSEEELGQKSYCGQIFVGLSRKLALVIFLPLT
jgi:hypothetical protein